MNGGKLLKRDLLFCSFNQPLSDGWPLSERLAAFTQLSDAKPRGGKVFTIDDHQLPAFLFIEQVYKTYVHHSARHLVALAFDERLDVLAIGTGSGLSVLR